MSDEEHQAPPPPTQDEVKAEGDPNTINIKVCAFLPLLTRVFLCNTAG